MAKSKGTVERNFYYYDMKAFFFDEKSKKSKEVKAMNRILLNSFRHFEKMQSDPNIKEDLIVKTESGDNFFVIVDEITDSGVVKFRMVLCRQDALPYVEKNGVLEFLTKYLPKNFSLAEITHCIMYTKYAIMGAEYNFSGARPSAIADYLRKFNEKIHYVSCKPKLNMDSFRKIEPDKDYSLFNLAIRKNSNAFVEVLNHSTVFLALNNSVNNFDYVEVIYRRRKGKKKEGFEPLLTEDEMEQLVRNYRDDLKSFKISQRAFKDKIDLLSDKFVHHAELIKTNNRTIKTSDAYREINDFFNEVVKQECVEIVNSKY